MVYKKVGTIYYSATQDKVKIYWRGNHNTSDRVDILRKLTSYIKTKYLELVTKN